MADESPSTLQVSGELSNHKVGALFQDEGAARAAAGVVRDALGLSEAQVQVVTGREQTPGRKIQPESRGIFKTVLMAHAKLGIAGAVVGLLAFLVLAYALGIPMFANSPVTSALVLIGFGAVAGLMVGGLVSLRPDQEAYSVQMREGVRDGRVAVVVHAFDREQMEKARTLLEERSGEVTATL